MYRGEHSIRFYPARAETKPDGPRDRTQWESRNYIGGAAYDDSFLIDSWPDTWRTWHLIPTDKVIFAPPKAKESPLEIPGRHGTVDSNRYVHNHPVYANRTGSVEFVVDPDYDWRRTDLHSRITQFLQGKDVLAVLRDDRAYYYKGRFSVSDIKPGEYGDTITLTYDLEPFKYDRWYGKETTGGSGEEQSRLERNLTVTPGGTDFIVTDNACALTGLPGYTLDQYPVRGETLYLAPGQTVVLEGGQDIPEGAGEMTLAPNQILKLKGDGFLSVTLKNGDLVTLPDEEPLARVWNPARIWISEDAVRAALANHAAGSGTPFTLASDTEITLTGAEELDGWMCSMWPDGDTSDYARAQTLAYGSYPKPVSGGTAVLKGGQTLRPYESQYIFLADGQDFTLAGGQTVTAFAEGYPEITLAGGEVLRDPVRMLVPADWAAWGRIVPTRQDDDDDDYIADDFDPQNHVPFGVRTFALTSASIWVPVDIPDGCYITPEFKCLTLGGQPEASIDEGLTWHPVGFDNWKASERIRLGSGRLLLRGPGTLKVRCRGGWL